MGVSWTPGEGDRPSREASRWQNHHDRRRSKGLNMAMNVAVLRWPQRARPEATGGFSGETRLTGPGGNVTEGKSAVAFLWKARP